MSYVVLELTSFLAKSPVQRTGPLTAGVSLVLVDTYLVARIVPR